MVVAQADGRILISVDTDFGDLLATSGVTIPSVIVLRRTDKRPGGRLGVILANVTAVADELSDGALAVIGDSKIRIRRLRIRGDA